MSAGGPLDHQLGVPLTQTARVSSDFSLFRETKKSIYQLQSSPSLSQGSVALAYVEVPHRNHWFVCPVLEFFTARGSRSDLGMLETSIGLVMQAPCRIRLMRRKGCADLLTEERADDGLKSRTSGLSSGVSWIGGVFDVA